MVAKKSAKAAKASYAERVLGAFSQVQREHRKHSVHIASLQAQVKKTAQENKDRLGPHWSTWVGKAINKLAEEGIFTTSPSAGNLTITPNGTQAITAARKSLSLAINTSPSAVPEDLIWKHITQQPLISRAQTVTRGIKRGRRSTIHNAVVEEEHEPLSTASSNGITARRSKRARISVAASSPSKVTRTKRARVSMATTAAPGTPSKKPFSKMNKAELQAELRALRKQSENEQWLRETSPLTDLDEDAETARLRVELQERTEEISRMRRELAAAKAAAQQLTSEPGSSHRLPTPDIDAAPTSTLRSAISVVVPRSKAPNGVIRTQSGSHISLVSKQPTPAPSSPGTDAIDLPATGEGRDDFTMHERNDDDRVQPWLQITTLGSGIMTSDSTSNGDALKVLQLEHDLASRVTAMNNLQAQFSQLQTDYAEVQQSVAERDARLSQLSDNIARLEADVASKDSVLDRQTFRLEGFDRDLRSRDASLASAKADRETDRAEIHRIQAKLSAAEESQRTLTSQVAETENEVAALRGEIAQKKSTLDTESEAHQVIRAGLETQLQTLLATKSELERKVEALESSKSTMTAYLAKATEDHALLSKQLRDAEGANESLRSQLTIASDENSTLTATLAASDRSVATLTSRISAMEVSQSQYKANIEKLTLSLAVAEQDTTSLRQQVTFAENSATNFQSVLDVSQRTANELRTQIETTTAERDGLTSQLEAALVTITSLNELNARLTTDCATLDEAVTVTVELKGQLLETTDKLVAREDQIQRLEEAASTKDRELARLVDDLSIAESMAGKFRAESTASDAKVKELRTQLTEVQAQVLVGQELLASTKASHTAESDKHTSAISELETSLQGAHAEIDASKEELRTVNSAYAEVQNQLDQQSLELGEIRVNLESACLRASKLESELEVALRKAQEAEEEVIGLRTSKEADEATIENLKGMFLSLKETQMQSLAELNLKVVSTKSSPAPKRRSARNTSNKGPVPFKLT